MSHERRRFNKANVLGAIALRASNQRQAYRDATGKWIDPGNGYAQVPANDKEAALHYGAWRALMDLHEAIEEGWL